MTKPIFEFQKNSTERVRASFEEYRGAQLADVRVYYEDDEGKWLPTRKGLAISVSKLPELKQAVDALIAAARPHRAAENDE